MIFEAGNVVPAFEFDVRIYFLASMRKCQDKINQFGQFILYHYSIRYSLTSFNL